MIEYIQLENRNLNLETHSWDRHRKHVASYVNQVHRFDEHLRFIGYGDKNLNGVYRSKYTKKTYGIFPRPPPGLVDMQDSTWEKLLRAPGHHT